ncbi:receptor-like protein 7 [Arachis hypogaea]|uniref:receptor-like protein 7 n=1 Tax=Arachis hypogaea TaxID=3818 RepID=UPI0010FC6379|nr:receptor-like protein 53 [Arachis hypogaea]
MGYFVRVVMCVHMFMLFHFFTCLSSHSCHSEETSALLHFKTELITDTAFYEYDRDYADLCPHVYPKMSTWGNGTNCCSWMGVTCHSLSGHVIGLDLSCSGVVGNIHPNSTLFHLIHLQTLSLAYNYIYGDVPFQISHLYKLQSLDLSWNHELEWKESTWKRMLQNATALSEIVLDKTDMTLIGPTPNPFSLIANLSSTLVTLSLDDTSINGYVTSDMLCLPNLQYLSLSSPPGVGHEGIQIHVLNLNCTTSLRFLDLSRCYFQGPIPSSFSNLTYLTSLNLVESNLNGSIPSSLSNLQHLTHLDLSGNRLKGSIPSSFSNLHHLTYLDLSSNRLGGQIPNVFDRLTNLQTLFLQSNYFGRKLPPSLFTLTQLSVLDCSYNKIVGPLPDKAAFSNLTQLILNDNLLNGTIPWWVLSFKSLRYLDLSDNRFTGHINEIKSYSLEYLDLCNNELHGNIPESIFDLVNLTDLCLLSHSSWSGTLHFPLFSKLQKLVHLSLSGCNSLLLNSETSVNYTFSNLRTLKLLSNNIIGHSTFYGVFPQIEYLELSNNKLDGKVPKWIQDMDSLLHLNLSHNSFTSIGQFPWHRLEFLDLSFNSMVDDISSFFCNEINLRNINLSHNNFTGTFPQCLLNISLPLALDIQMNKLHGTLPDTFNHLVLVTLNLNGNQFEGLLPKSLPNCTELVDLNLGNNQFEDTFPNWLQNLLNLKILVLRGNKLHGPIAELKSEKMFSSLIIFDISSNNFSGSLPKSYIKNFQAMKIPGDKEHSWSYYIQTGAGISGEGRIQPEYHDSITATIKGTNTPYAKIPRVLAMIDLSENKFEGEIPDVFGELQALISLNLSHNSLIGPIPRSLGNLTNLESLDLSSNMLDGNIPAELTNLNFLEVLNLSQNQLVGPIPRGKQFDTFSNNSYVGNLGLCGLPLSIQCNNNVPLKQYPSSEAEDKFGFGWKPVAIGYACGMVLGIGLGFCVFSIGKPQWLVIMFGGKRIKRRSRGNRRARTT